MGDVVITREDSIKILQEVRANHKALESCPGPHDFQPRADKRYRFTCTICGGEIDGSDKWHYDQGLAHGRARKG